MSNNFRAEEHEARIEALLSQMTLEEKVGQLDQLSPSIVGGFDVPFEELIEMVTEGRISQDEFGKIMAGAQMDYREDDIRAGKIGSFLMNNPRKANELQKIAVEESRLGIPLIFGFDVIHGFHTVFPIPLAEACSWNEGIFEQSAMIAAKEARAQNIQWTFAPMVDIARDARWGRIAESPGEDPYLASIYAAAKVRGFQGETLGGADRVASCLKHFVAYGAAESGQDYNTVSMADSMLFNGYLPPFKAGIEAGAATVMGAFNDYNGVPCTVSDFLLREVLKEKYDFNGFVVSDANAIDDCVRHGIASNLEEASRKALTAGMDMDMNSHAYSTYLKNQVETGQVSQAHLDDAVRRILRVKMAVGLFEHPYVPEEKINLYDQLPEEHIEAARDAAKRSIVLLKNEQVLPLRKDQRIGLIGELANLETEVLGTWAMAGRAKDCVSIYQGLVNAGVPVVYEKTCGVTTPFEPEVLKKIVQDVDVLVAVVGETAAMSGEASSKADIGLPGEQQKMIEAALAYGKPVVVVLMNGRPLTIGWMEEKVAAIVEAWQLGIQMGNAVTDVLYGAYNPSGKLCCTFPAMVGQCPQYYNRPSTGRPGGKSKFSSRYLDAPLQPLYPFGFGLSYTTFEYSNMVVEPTSDVYGCDLNNPSKDQLVVRVDVTNTGLVSGEETVQVYVRDMVASIVRPTKELKAFQKVTLNSGEKATVEIPLLKSSLGFYNNQMAYLLEDGLFQIFVGTNSRDCLMTEVSVKFL